MTTSRGHQTLLISVCRRWPLSRGEIIIKFLTTLSVIVLIGLVSPSSAADNPRCIEEYDAEIERITRESGRNAVEKGVKSLLLTIQLR